MKKLTLILIILLSCTLVFAQSISESKVSVQMRSSDAELAAAFKSQTGIQILFNGPEFDIYDAYDFSPVASKDALEDLTDILPRKIIGSMMPYVSDGEGIYAYPYGVKTSGIAINAEILAAAGVDPESIKTWYDFEKACQQLRFNGYKPIAMDSEGAAWFVRSAIAGFFNGAKEAELAAGKFDAAVFDNIPAMLDRWVKKGYVVESGEAGFTFAEGAEGDIIPFPSADGNPQFVTELEALAVAKGADAKFVASMIFELVTTVYIRADVDLSGLNYAQRYLTIEAADAIQNGAAAVLAQEAGAVAALTKAVSEAF